MPIYEYECESCHQVFEVFQRHSDPAPASHECGSTRVRRLLSNTSFILKGTGWYATDYAAPAKADAKKGAGAKDGKSEGDKASAASEQKTAPADASLGAKSHGGKAGGDAKGDAGSKKGQGGGTSAAG